MPDLPDSPPANLAPTALYTAGVWAWADVPCADVLACDKTAGAFRVVNRLHDLARRFRPDAPSLRHSLAQRHAMLDHLGQDADHLIELASGLSPRGLHRAGAGLHTVEVDLPPVVAEKRRRLLRHPSGRAALQGPLTLVAADATTVDLDSLAPEGMPVTLLVEGLAMYLDPEQQRALFARAAALVAQRPESCFLLDLTPPDEEPRPGPLGRALGWLMRLVTRGQGFVEGTRDRATLRRELLDAGFRSVTAYDPEHPPADLELPYPDATTWCVIWEAR